MEMPTCTSSPTRTLPERDSLSPGAARSWPALANRKLSAVLTPSHLLLGILVSTLLWRGNGALPYHLLVLTIVVAAVGQLRKHLAGSGESATAADDIAALVYAALLAWHLVTSRFGVVDKMLFPTPETVLTVFLSELPELVKGARSSLVLLVSGYLLALVTAIPLGLVTGWRRRLFHAVNPFTKVLGPIPPIVYIPYAIALLPTFKLASIFVIFVGAFWPIFVNTVNGVFGISPGLIDVARVLDLKEGTLLWRVILPGALPSICTGATLALVFSFILLAAAELIGASSGIGWYIKNYSDFADYPRVITGIIFLSLMVTAISFGTDRLERRLLRWRKQPW